MSDRNYRSYSQEFKLEALELLQRGDKSAGQIERELGITPGLLLKWKARYQIDTTVHRIDALRYELHGLTHKEIWIVEGKLSSLK